MAVTTAITIITTTTTTIIIIIITTRDFLMMPPAEFLPSAAFYVQFLKFRDARGRGSASRSNRRLALDPL
jgi:hypothetical protein